MLVAQNISLKIGDTPILHEVSCTIAEGEMVGLIGPNGSGKTTLFNCFSGFLYPQHGTITFRDVEVTHLPAAQRARLGLGRIFQNFGIFREMSLVENMLLALESRNRTRGAWWPWGRAAQANREAAIEFLKRIQLDHKSGEKAGSLSGGQMRLLEITRTLATGAKLLLLDEPTAGVSPKMKDDVASIILDLKAEKKTVVVIEHDINFIQKFCDRIIVLDVGRVVLDGTPEEVKASPLLREIYFGS